MSENFKDFFSKQAAIYAKARPSYPDELFKYLASLCNEHNLAWDCATGNGQAARSLAHYFKRIIATDASKEQLKLAAPHLQVEYREALAEKSGLEANSADIVTIANAIHWFDLEKFYSEVDRVLKTGGVLAAWCYGNSFVDEKVDAVMTHLARVTLKDYWPEGNKMVVSGYKDLKLPFKEIIAPQFDFISEATEDNLIGFAYSWSSTQRYIDRHGKDPVEPVKEELQHAWGNAKTKPMTWKLALKVARK
jgi:ubiquinone/menaquinone biosynthesis C-methylase UbiE